MKKVFTLLTIVLLSSASLFANQYKLDDAKVDAMFASAQTLTINDDANLIDLTSYGTTSNQATVSGKNPIATLLLCAFLGWAGVHRIYLGTSTGVWIGYLAITTCGVVGCFIIPIFGAALGFVIPAIDGLFLLIGLINNDISKYENNTKFFMW